MSIVVLQTDLEELLAGYFGDWLEGNYIPLPEKAKRLEQLEELEQHKIIEWSINRQGKVILTISDDDGIEFDRN